MPRTFAKLPALAVTARFSGEDGAYLHELARVVRTANRTLRELVTDSSRPCDLPDRIVQALQAVAARLGKSRRQYFAHILRAPAPELIAGAREESTARTARAWQTGGGL